MSSQQEVDVNTEAFNQIISVEDFVKFKRVRCYPVILEALEIARQLTELESDRELMNERLTKLMESVKRTTLNWGEVSETVSPECYGLNGGKHEECSYAKKFNPETEENPCVCICHHADYYPDR